MRDMKIDWKEVLFWTGLVALIWTIHFYTQVERQVNLGDQPYVPRILVEEASSGGMVLLLLYPLLKWLRWVTKNVPTPNRQIAYMALAFLPFSAAHIVGMFSIRMLVFEAQGYEYSLLWVLENQAFFELRIDVLLFIGLVAIHFLRLKFIGEEELPRFMKQPGRLLLKTDKGQERLETKDIHFIEVEENYVTVKTKDKSYFHRSSLAKLEAKLPSDQFCRVHRKFMVNVNRIDRVKPTKHGDFTIHLRSGETIPLSRRYREALKERFEV